MSNLFFSNASILNEDPRNRGRFTGLTSETTGQQLPQQQIDPLSIGAGAFGSYQAGKRLNQQGRKFLESPISQNVGSYFNTGDTTGLKNVASQQGWFGYNPEGQAALPNTYGQSVLGSVQDVTRGYDPGTYNPNVNPNFYPAHSPPQAGGLLSPVSSSFAPEGSHIMGQFDGPYTGGGGFNSLRSGTGPTQIPLGGPTGSALDGIDVMAGTMGDAGFYGGGIADFTSDSVGAMADGAGDLIDATGANTTGMSGLLSKAGSLAGLGLSAYDIANSGINAGNALGLVGSGLGTAAAFSTNPALMAMGPWGWGLAGLGTVGSLMDWW